MIRSGATYGTSFSVGTARISKGCLNPRPWDKYPMNGNHPFPLTGFPDGVYMEDWEKFIKEKAGPDGIIMQPNGFRYMDVEFKQSLQTELDRLNAIVNPTVTHPVSGQPSTHGQSSRSDSHALPFTRIVGT